MNAESKYTLGIETATPVCSAAIVTREKSVAEYTLNTGASHEPHLMPMIERILCDTGIELRRLASIAVSTGPGSFTGLRIGLATAKGLALAQDIPLIGIPTLDGLSYNVAAAEIPHPAPCVICPLIDARKGEVYSALYRYKEMEKLTDYMVLPLMELLKQITEPTLFTGHIHLYREKIEKELGARALFAPPQLTYPKAASIAHLGILYLSSLPIPLTPPLIKGAGGINPIYLRKARAEEQLEITIGEMTEEDTPHVMAIEKESFPNPWSEDMFRSKHRNSGKPIFLVAKLREKILGYICGWALHDELHLGNIAIQRDFRSRGISKRLLQRIIDIARSREIKLVTLEVRAGNAPAQNLYRKFGFDVTDRHREYYQDTKEDAIVMSMNLNPPYSPFNKGGRGISE